MMATSVISQPTSAIVEFNTIAKIRKYKEIHEGHHFILIAMEVHNAPKCDMDCFIRDMLVFSTIDDQEVVYPCIFAFNFSSNVLVLLINMLQFLL
jgi:hypothetical protein